MVEITKLHKMLTEAGVNHTFMKMDADIFGKDSFQIRIYSDHTFNKELDDAVFHKYSHGYRQGLLETYNLNNCDGYETAEQVFKGWMKKYFSKTS